MNWQNFVIGSTYYVGASNCQPNLYQFVPQLHYNEQLLNQFQIFIVQKSELAANFPNAETNPPSPACLQETGAKVECQHAQSSKRNKKTIELKQKREEKSGRSRNEQPPTKDLCCQCRMSNCIKQYCFCFKNGEGCTDKCTCLSCRNMESRGKQVRKVKRVKTVVCNCTRSECSKKYCECFANGKKCGELCNCINCQN